MQHWEPEQPCRLGFPLSSSATDAWIKGYVDENYDSLAEQLKPDAIEEDDESIDGVLLKDVALMTVVSLRKALKARGCKNTGKKVSWLNVLHIRSIHLLLVQKEMARRGKAKLTGEENLVLQILLV